MKLTYPLQKIVVNVGLGKLSSQAEFEQKTLPEVIKAVAAITGQKPQSRPARKSIAGFKLRQNAIIGLKVTLRRKRMMQFLEKVAHLVTPRIRDFRGISLKSIDANGNLTFGIKEHTVFPEIILENSHVSFGIEITLVPRTNIKPAEAVEFYRSLGIPFEKTK